MYCNMNTKQAFQIIKKILDRKGIYVEGDENEASFSLSQLGLSGVYATIEKQEFEYFIDSLDEDDEKDYLEMINE